MWAPCPLSFFLATLAFCIAMCLVHKAFFGLCEKSATGRLPDSVFPVLSSNLTRSLKKENQVLSMFGGTLHLAKGTFGSALLASTTAGVTRRLRAPALWPRVHTTNPCRVRAPGAQPQLAHTSHPTEPLSHLESSQLFRAKHQNIHHHCFRKVTTGSGKRNKLKAPYKRKRDGPVTIFGSLGLAQEKGNAHPASRLCFKKGALP